jgi:hypothetical protein
MQAFFIDLNVALFAALAGRPRLHSRAMGHTVVPVGHSVASAHGVVYGWANARWVRFALALRVYRFFASIRQ